MEKPKVKHRPRRLRARPLLVAAAITMATVSGCDEFAHGTIANQQDLSVADSAPADFGLAPRD